MKETDEEKRKRQADGWFTADELEEWWETEGAFIDWNNNASRLIQ